MLVNKESIQSKCINLYDLQKYKIGIPIFQRFYAWKEKETTQLKDDIIKIIGSSNIDNPDYQLYLLDFIYYEEDEKIKIADGQQRIVSINNLIKAIKDIAKEKNILIDDIELFDIEYDVFSNKQKYEKHFFNYPISPFKKVYLDFYDFVKKHISQINNIIKVIKNRIFIFAKKCDNADDAFTIFQQINTGGKPLTKDEVIKTALDQYSLAYDLKYDTSDMKDVRQSLISFYKYKKHNYDSKFDSIEIISFIKEYISKDKETFRDFVETVSILKSLEKNPIKYIISYINRQTIMDVVNILSMNKIDIIKESKYTTDLLIPLCMMSIVLSIKGGSPTSFRYLINDIIDGIKANKKPEELNKELINRINSDDNWQIKLEDFEKALEKNEISRGIKKALLIIDVICRNKSGIINVNSINLEHIYPQRPDPEWAQNGWPSHREQQEEIIDNIGNYLLLNSEVNKKIQNQYITHKVDKYKKIITDDILLQTPMNIIDFDRFESEQINYINERKKQIAKYIQMNFPLGRVLIKN